MTPESKPKTPTEDVMPITLTEVRQMVLDAAGFTPEEAGRLLRLSARKLEQKLEAKKTQFFTHEGKVTDKRECEDNGAQIKAAEALANLGADVMALKRRAGAEKPAPPNINIDLSGWTVQPKGDEHAGGTN